VDLQDCVFWVLLTQNGFQTGLQDSQDLQDFFAKAKSGFTGLYAFGGCVFRPPMKTMPLNDALLILLTQNGIFRPDYKIIRIYRIYRIFSLKQKVDLQDCTLLVLLTQNDFLTGFMD
jgi:hypothetical protein